MKRKTLIFFEVSLIFGFYILAYYMMGSECQESKLKIFTGFSFIFLGSCILGHLSSLVLAQIQALKDNIAADFAPIIFYCGAIAVVGYFSPCYESFVIDAFWATTLGIAMILAVFTPILHLD